MRRAAPAHVLAEARLQESICSISHRKCSSIVYSLQPVKASSTAMASPGPRHRAADTADPGTAPPTPPTSSLTRTPVKAPSTDRADDLGARPRPRDRGLERAARGRRWQRRRRPVDTGRPRARLL